MASVTLNQKHAVLPVLAVRTPMKAVGMCYHLSCICIDMEPFWYTNFYPSYQFCSRKHGMCSIVVAREMPTPWCGNYTEASLPYYMSRYTRGIMWIVEFRREIQDWTWEWDEAEEFLSKYINRRRWHGQDDIEKINQGISSNWSY